MLFKKKRKNDDSVRRIVLNENAPSRIVEGYNRLRDNIMFMSADGSNRVIQIESALSGEGKTSIACNLAVCLGQTNKKTVIVDLDFRKPKAHALFGLSKDVGISEYVLGTADKEQIVKQTGYKNVSLVTGGARIHNSSLVLTSGVFQELMAYLREQFDYVILDCAPILQISDYIHISKVSDGVLFVAAYSQTTKAQAVDAVKELKKNNIPILGSVFSMYDKRKEKGYDYKHYYYYSYSSSYYDHVDDEQKEEKDKK